MTSGEGARVAGCCCSPASEVHAGDDDNRIRAWWDDMQQEKFSGFELIPHLARLLAEAQHPVTLNRVADAASWTVQDVEAALRRHPGVDWDDKGRLAGFGLTLRPTPHRFIFDDRTVYGFCASDTLAFPVVLGSSGVIESTCPATGQTIRVEVTPEHLDSLDPPTAVVSLVRPDTFDDIRREGCDLGRFFASRGSAAEWQAAHPEGMIHSVEEEFQQTREMTIRAGWAHPTVAEQ